MPSIYGITELEYAISDATARQISIRMAEDMLHRSWLMSGWEGVSQTAAEYGVNAVVNAEGYPLFYTKAVIEGAGETAAELSYATATEAAIDSVTNEVVVKEVAQVATQGATKTLSAGGVTAAMTALSVVGAVATGAGLGWESYKEHPDAWTDLSEAIFMQNTSKETPLEVIARAHAGGYTTATKEENLAKIIQGLAKEGCFDYREYDSQIDHTGTQSVTWSEAPALGQASSLGKQYLSQHYPGSTCVYTEQDYLRDGHILEANVMILQNLPSTAEVYSGVDAKGHSYYYATGVYPTSVLVRYDINTEQATYTESTDNYPVPSGQYYFTNDLYGVGGCSCNITVVDGNNDLFPNDHSATNLMIPPDASLLDIADALRDQFPDWYADSWEQPEYDPESDSIVNKRYYPITAPWWDYNNESKDPSYDQDHAQDGEIKPESDPKSEEQGKEITNIPVDDIFPPPAPVPIPDPTPLPVPLDDDTSDALWSVYNPTMSELNQLGAYLWSSNIIDILQKFLQNPMDAIISLHKIFATPTTGAAAHIALGYLDSGVSAATVTKQFIELDCGSVTVPEYFGDARDYDSPYTEVECYLPFIGIVRLKTADIIGGKVNIKYSIDAYSGACLCKIYITKLGVKQLLYNYSSNCSMQIPLTGSDRTRLLSGAVAGAVGGAAVGGPVGAVAGAVAGAWKGGTSIERTSGFTANAGCMGVKKPYLLITRKYSYDAGNYNKYYGYPTNITVNLSSCKGYTRVKSAHIESIGRATDSEKREIETLLKQGVIIK